VDNACNTVDDVVRWMGVMQAQDYKQALWAIGVRMGSACVADVEDAIAEGKIVRTWSQRGTIHFVPAEDIDWMLALCASRILHGHGRRMKQLDLTEAIMGQSRDLIGNKLTGGQSLSRSEIFEVLEQDGVSTDGQRGYHILWHLAHQGVICMTGQNGRDADFVLVDEWIPDRIQLSREEALAELVRRYFRSHAPATEHDFAKWSGLTLTDTRKGIQMNTDTLDSFERGDVTYWTTGEYDPVDSSDLLLPAYDEYVLGYKDRDDVLDPQFADRICPGNNGVFQPLIVIDGQIVGIWKRKLKTTSVDIELHPFTTLGDVQDAVLAEAERYGEFMGLSVNIVKG